MGPRATHPHAPSASQPAAQSASVIVNRMPSVFISRFLLHVPERCHNRQRARELPAARRFVFVSHRRTG